MNNIAEKPGTGTASPSSPRLTIQDVTKSRTWRFTPSNHNESVGDVLREFVSQTQQVSTDSSGREVTYTLRGDDREGGVRLHASQPVTDLQDGDVLTLSPSVQAG